MHLCDADPHRVSLPTPTAPPAELQDTRTLCGLSHMTLTGKVSHTLRDLSTVCPVFVLISLSSSQTLEYSASVLLSTLF